MHIKITLALWALLALGCSSPERKARRIERKMIEQLPLLFADEMLPVVFTPGRLDSAATACNGFRQMLNPLRERSLQPTALGALEQAERFLSKHEVVLQNLVEDPSTYNLGGYLKTSLAQTSIPLEKRLNSIQLQMERAAPYYASALQNLQRPDPARTRIAVEKHLLTLEFLQTELPDSLWAASIPDPEAKALLATLNQTRMEVKNYLAFCRSMLFEHQDSTMAKELLLKK